MPQYPDREPPQGRKVTPTDFKSAILADPKSSPEMRALAHALGKPGPADPMDAHNIERSYRVRDSLEQAGFKLDPSNDGSKYPRGVLLNHTSGQHNITLVPHERGGWHASITSTRDDTYLERLHEDVLHVDDSHIVGALRVHLARPDVQEALRPRPTKPLVLHWDENPIHDSYVNEQRAAGRPIVDPHAHERDEFGLHIKSPDYPTLRADWEQARARGKRTPWQR